MGYRFDDKVILVTGAASGIGRATAQKLATLGATLSLSDIKRDGLVETRRLCGGDKHSLHLVDVGSSGNCIQFVEDSVEQHGKIDGIFNCAGVNPTAIAIEKTSDEYIDLLLNVNLKSMIYITRAASPHLQAGASFVNVSSISGLSSSAQTSIYNASKAAVIAFSKAIAFELGPRGIRTNIVCPGFINTPTNASVVKGQAAVEAAHKQVALGKMAEPSEVADVVAFLFSDEARYMNGSVVQVDGGLPRQSF